MDWHHLVANAPTTIIHIPSIIILKLQKSYFGILLLVFSPYCRGSQIVCLGREDPAHLMLECENFIPAIHPPICHCTNLNDLLSLSNSPLSKSSYSWFSLKAATLELVIRAPPSNSPLSKFSYLFCQSFCSFCRMDILNLACIAEYLENGVSKDFKLMIVNMATSVDNKARPIQFIYVGALNLMKMELFVDVHCMMVPQTIITIQG